METRKVVVVAILRRNSVVTEQERVNDAESLPEHQQASAIFFAPDLVQRKQGSLDSRGGGMKKNWQLPG